MKAAFLLIVYKNPEQVYRLIKRLSCDEFYFFVHIDKKVDIKPYLPVKTLQNTYLLESRTDVIWASYGFTELVLHMTRNALSHPVTFDFISTMSGHCYPIKPVRKIVEFLSKNREFSFLEWEHADSSWYKIAESRYIKYHLTNFRFRGKHRLQILLSYILPKRKQLFFERIYGGPRATWWTLSREACSYVLNYFDNTKGLVSFFKYTWAIDEILIPSILLNSTLSSKICKNGLRYIDWSTNTAHPKILTLDDYPILERSRKLFARKFDTLKDERVLDKIDNLLDNQP